MKKLKIHDFRPLAFLSLMLSTAALSTLSGCAAAAIGAGGAAGGIAFTERGAKGDVKGPVSQVNERAKEALQEMQIQVTGNSSQNSGKEQSLDGKSGSTEVSVKMSQSAHDMTHIEVIAKEGTLKWNKDYAQTILSKIIHKL